MPGFILTFLLAITLQLQPALVEDKPCDRVEKIDSIVHSFHSEGKFNGVILLAQNDTILYEGAFGKANFEWDVPHTLDSKFRIASITKTYTAALTVLFIEQGKLGFNDVITDHLSDYPADTGSRITIENLLTQTSGIPDYIRLPGFLETKSQLEHDIHEFPGYFKNLELNFDPGSDWDYGNSEYYLLGLIIEKITGLTYEEALNKYILEPSGLEHTGFFTADGVIEKFSGGYVRTESGITIAPIIHPSVCYSAGMMYSTAPDMHKFLQALYRNNSILSKDFTDKMTTQRIADYGYGVYTGYQVINGVSHPAFLHMGEIPGYNSQVSYFPKNDFTVIIMDNTRQCPSRLYFAILDFLPGFSSQEVDELAGS